MSADLASQRYLQRHIEPGLPPCPRGSAPWRNALVIPAYREPASLLRRLEQMPAADGRTLVILVLNRPASDPDRNANSELRAAVDAIPDDGATGLRQLNRHTSLFVHDVDRASGPIPTSRGVGMARKIGCDIAFKWQSEGALSSRWICLTDADASLPADYFQRLESIPGRAAAACYPFWHSPGGDRACNLATALYELRLHQYVLGLAYAGSPYAHHTLGSCMAVTFEAYAAVRGFPKRAGAEDFYLLNKLAKTGPVVQLAGQCIELECRLSDRVPFGTGPAVAKISGAPDPREYPLFYHPACFDALRGVLNAAPRLEKSTPAELPALLAAAGVEQTLRRACCSTLEGLGFAPALAHCRSHGKSSDQYLRQFHQWFDAFRTLKFVHGIRDAGWPALSLSGLSERQPVLWPGAGANDVDSLRRRIAQHWNWCRNGARQPSQAPAGTSP